MTGAFLFGKLPAHGDFVSRGLTAAERETMDAWLSAEMAAARAALREHFEQAFDAAPPWRFTWNTGDGWTAGALAPSIDGVGRRYPVLLGRRGLTAGEAGCVAEACEDTLYAALTGGWSADMVIESAQAGAAGAATRSPDSARWWTAGGAGYAPAERAGQWPERLICALLTATGGSAA